MKRKINRSRIETLECRKLMTVTFAAPVSYSLAAPDDSSGVVAADFTGDGKADIAAVNQEADLLSLLVNNGDGTFAAPVSIPTGDEPGGIVAADFNGDGATDLALTIFNTVGTDADDELHVLINNGGGSFGAPVVTDTGGVTPLSIAAGDVNADGKTDVVTGNFFTTGDVSVLIGLGNGQFADPVTYATGASAVGVALGDVNDDTKPDIAVALDNGTVGMLLNAGNGTFGATGTFDLGKGSASRAQSVAIGQFTSDTIADLAVTMEDGGGGVILAGDGAGAFAVASGFEAASLDGLLATDFDADGVADLAVTSETGRYVAVHQRGNAGTYAEAYYDFVNAKPDRLASADFNGDGKPDLVATGETTGESGAGVLDVLLNTTAGSNDNGGGGGGGNEEPIPQAAGPDLVADLVVTSPVSVIGGAKAKATANVINLNSTAANGPVSVALYASADGVLDDADTLVTNTTSNLKLKAGGSKKMKIAFNFPSLPDGSYTLLAKVDAQNAFAESDEANNVSAATTGPVTIAAPFVDLSGAFTALPTTAVVAGKKSGAAITVQNNGNQAFQGPVTVKVFASADDVLDASDVELTTLTKTLNLKPGAAKAVKLKFDVPAGIVAGAYRFVATISPAGSLADADLSNNTLFSLVPVTFA